MRVLQLNLQVPVSRLWPVAPELEEPIECTRAQPTPAEGLRALTTPGGGISYQLSARVLCCVGGRHLSCYCLCNFCGCSFVIMSKKQSSVLTFFKKLGNSSESVNEDRHLAGSSTGGSVGDESPSCLRPDRDATFQGESRDPSLGVQSADIAKGAFQPVDCFKVGKQDSIQIEAVQRILVQ
ncbi:hypothetical protein J6590_099952 [Homalodisca vitripennis]|nr:hypothetical protein J6590_099952 [Homalodisca vitripennis]